MAEMVRLASGVQSVCILWSDLHKYVMIYWYHHHSLDGESVEACLEHLWPVIVPEEAGVAQEVLEVVRVPARVLPIKEGQVKVVFVV